MSELPKHEWVSLLKRERRQREELGKRVADDKIDDPVALREWWASVAEILYAIQNRLGTPPDPMPMELLFILADTAAYLAKGTIPAPIRDVRGKGRAKPGPTETRDIRWAVTYRDAVERGWINDKSPSKPIVQAYGLKTQRTVQEWCQAYAPFGEDTHHNDPDLIRFRMEESGRRYSVANQRTHAAIQKRGKRGERK